MKYFMKYCIFLYFFARFSPYMGIFSQGQLSRSPESINPISNDFWCFRQDFCIPQLKFDEIKKSLFNFGSIFNSPASSTDTPVALQAKMVGWQGSATWLSYIYIYILDWIFAQCSNKLWTKYNKLKFESCKDVLCYFKTKRQYARVCIE